jgi:hypothetical protein
LFPRAVSEDEWRDTRGPKEALRGESAGIGLARLGGAESGTGRGVWGVAESNPLVWVVRARGFQRRFDSDVALVIALAGEVKPTREIDRLSAIVADICLRHDLLFAIYPVPAEWLVERKSPLSKISAVKGSGCDAVLLCRSAAAGWRAELYEPSCGDLSFRPAVCENGGPAKTPPSMAPDGLREATSG